MQRRFALKALTAAVALSVLTAMPAFAADTIKIARYLAAAPKLLMLDEPTEGARAGRWKRTGCGSWWRFEGHEHPRS